MYTHAFVNVTSLKGDCSACAVTLKPHDMIKKSTYLTDILNYDSQMSVADTFVILSLTVSRF